MLTAREGAPRTLRSSSWLRPLFEARGGSQPRYEHAAETCRASLGRARMLTASICVREMHDTAQPPSVREHLSQELQREALGVARP